MASTTSSSALQNSENVFDVEEVEYVVLSFPLFRNFGDVALVKERGAEIPLAESPAGASVDENGNAILSIVKGSIASNKPIVKFGSMLFEGTWTTERHCSVRKATNLSVAVLQRQKVDRSAAKHRREQIASRQHVASLQKHLQGTQDSDTVAHTQKLEEELRREAWTYETVIAPQAIANMRRVA